MKHRPHFQQHCSGTICSFSSSARKCCSSPTNSHVLCLVTQLCPTLCHPMDCGPPGSSVHGDSPGKNTGESSYVLLQGIFPTQGLKPGLPHCRWILFLFFCRWILYHLNHQGSPRIMEWVAYPFSRGSSQPRNRIGVSCVAGGFFTDMVN